MKIVVTGGSGLTGRAVVADLAEHGHSVLNVDRVKPEQSPAPHRFADLQDLGQVYGCLGGADAVIHLAAIPRPIYDTNEVVFRTNTMATYNLLEAAAALGIRRVVLASSMAVFGYPFFYRPIAPAYAPIDDEHPHEAQDPYAISKVVGEQLADAFVRRAEMAIISLRLSWIHTPETFRQQLTPFWADPAGGASNLWSYVDSRDVAQAFRLALTADLTGHHAMIVAAPDSFMKTPTADLVRQYYPNTTIRPELQGRGSLLSSARAERLLGYKAAYTWESYF